MSRSYKKSPIINDHRRRSTKENKQIANRRVRRMNKKLDGAPSRSYYKRATESWDISDYAWYWSKEQAIKEYEENELNKYIYKNYPTLSDWLAYWEKCAKRK